MEELKFKDVAGFYIGCKLQYTYVYSEKPVDMGIVDFISYKPHDHPESQTIEYRYRNGNERFDRESWGATRMFKPILFPLSAMTDEQLNELWNALGGIDYNFDKAAFGDALLHGSLAKTLLPYLDAFDMALATRMMIDWRFNVFNLPESEWIDASKLPVNPYLKS